MHFVILGLIILAVVFGPGLWVQHVLKRYSKPDDRYDGTGAELARHLIEKFGMDGVGVEETEVGDHYDPRDRMIRLTPDKYNGRSLTAITVAAHEFGHALQHHQQYKPLMLRTRMVMAGRGFEKLGAGILLVSPFVGLITRVPAAGALMFLGGLMTLGSSTLVHLVTLPTEINASFSRALPILEQGGYLRPEDRHHARRLLKAAALTYVSASLMSLLNIARWWAILRR